MQQFVNQRAKLRCDFWQPDFRPPDKGRFKTERPCTVKCGSGAVDLPTDGKSPAQGYGKTPSPLQMIHCQQVYWYTPFQGVPAAYCLAW